MTSRGAARPAGVLSPAPTRHPLVLVIDDERSVRMALTRCFERGGWEVRQAGLAEHRPELFERLIIATGDVASPSIREFIRRTSRPVLEKPFELGALAALMQRVTGGAEGTRRRPAQLDSPGTAMPIAWNPLST
jgi:hypothetical protein